MARIRTIKPDLTLDYELAQLGYAARYFFINLWCHCDREGRVPDEPEKLQVLILPWERKLTADQLLTELSPHFVIRYSAGKRRYVQVRNFLKHQRPNIKEIPSEIPAVPRSAFSLTCRNVKKDSKTLDKGNGLKGMEYGKGMEAGNPASARPTLEDVRSYCLERKNNVDHQRWLDHYASNGWRVGKNPMKDWKAAVRTWEKNEYGTSQSGRQGRVVGDAKPSAGKYAGLGETIET